MSVQSWNLKLLCRREKVIFFLSCLRADRDYREVGWKTDIKSSPTELFSANHWHSGCRVRQFWRFSMPGPKDVHLPRARFNLRMVSEQLSCVHGWQETRRLRDHFELLVALGLVSLGLTQGKNMKKDMEVKNQISHSLVNLTSHTLKQCVSGIWGYQGREACRNTKGCHANHCWQKHCQWKKWQGMTIST